jgi:hypothetical protein
MTPGNPLRESAAWRDAARRDKRQIVMRRMIPGDRRRIDRRTPARLPAGMHIESSRSAGADGRLEGVILALCAACGPAGTINPIDAAKAAAQLDVGSDDLAWRGLLTAVRRAAVQLARSGRLVIYRKGKPADPDDFRGVYRLGLPNEG